MGGPSLDPHTSLVTTPDGWFAVTPGGVVRLQLVHQPVGLADRWQVLASDLDQPGAVAVAPDGSVLVGDRGRVRRFSPDGQLLGQWSIPRPGDLSARVVDGLAQDGQGRIYVAEHGWDAYVFSPGTGGSVQRLDLDGRAAHGIALDGAGNVYLTRQPETVPLDDPPRAVAVVSPDDGSLLAQWGGPGTGPGQFSALPWGVALDAAGNVYVADAGNNRVQELAPDGSPLAVWDGLQAPAGIALDGAGNLYVAESLADRVVELAPDGTQLGTWGSSGSGLGQLWQPLGVAVDPTSGTIYVTDTLNNRLVRVDPGL
jgi:DNA-binding beta-propeller fold protein YncE